MIKLCTAAIVATLVLANPLSAQSAPLDPVSYEACGDANQFAAVAQSVASEPTSAAALRELSAKSVQIVPGAEGLDVKAGERHMTVKTAAGVSPATCSVVRPGTSVLLASGTLPGANVAALAAVLAYRHSFAWPFGAAHLDQRGTSLYLQTRGRYLFVSIIDKPSQANQLGCSGEEYYRVDAQSFAVLPFDGCIEGHAPSTALPGVMQLPA